MTSKEYIAACADSLLDNVFLKSPNEFQGREATENLHTFNITNEIAKQISVGEIKGLIQQAKNKFAMIVKNHYPGLAAILYVWHDIQAGALRFSIVTHREGLKLPFSSRIIEASLEQIISDWLQSEYLEGMPVENFTKAEIDALLAKRDSQTFKYPELAVHSISLV
jgi:hypothetical protein